MTALAKYDAAKRALAIATSVDEFKAVILDAKLLMVVAKAAKDEEMEMQARKLRFQAERALGLLLEAQRQGVGLNKGAVAGGTKVGPRGSYVDPRDTRPTLAEAGIDKHLATRARKAAKIPEAEFETAVIQGKRPQRFLTPTQQKNQRDSAM